MQKGILTTILNKNLFSSLQIIGTISLFFWNTFVPVFNQNQNPNSLYSIETSDHIIVVKNNTVIFEYLEQADIKEPVQIRVIETPKFGEVILNEDQSFGYTPSPDLCEVDDEFAYLLTSNGTSIKVTVSIEVLCESLTIFNGIAQNEDDKKLENFRILGVENYPENALHIFDNEGREIYEVEGYQNNWSGDVDSSEHLVDENLYYYVFSDGKGNYYSGYLMKH